MYKHGSIFILLLTQELVRNFWNNKFVCLKNMVEGVAAVDHRLQLRDCRLG